MRPLIKLICTLILYSCASTCWCDTPLYTSINNNSIKLFQHTPLSGNQLSSAYSIFNVFALLTPGSSGKTKTQLQHFFTFPNDLSQVTSLNRALQTKLGKNQLLINFSVWAALHIKVKPRYQKTVHSLFQAKIHHVNFDRPLKTVTAINRWVAVKTKNTIKHFLNVSDIKNAKTVLINTLFFHGRWASPFNPQNTTKLPFFTHNAAHHDVEMMHNNHSYPYTDNTKIQILSLPYQGKRLSLIIVLPKKGTTLKTVKQALTTSQFDHLNKSMITQAVRLSLPRFSFHVKTNLTATLKSMGLTQPFSNQANFSRLSTTPLTISSVIQSARIDVNEKGTKMTVASATIMVGEAISEPPQPIVFNANHPFLFILYDNKTQLIIAIGQVTKP